MPIMVKGNKSVLFVHIPKCGGSTFEKIMGEAGWEELLSIRKKPLSKIKFMRCSLQHMHADMLNEIVCCDKIDKIITLVRNPYDRMLSEYAWQLHQGLTKLSSERWIDDIFIKYKKDSFIFDNHIRPQNEFILSDSLVFKLEEGGMNAAFSVVQGLSVENIESPLIFSKRTEKTKEMRFFFQENKEKIIDFYLKDYELFNYSFD